jgi:bacteriorhodopsin
MRNNGQFTVSLPVYVRDIAEFTREVRAIMFDVLINLMVILSLGFPAVPWFFGARWRRRGIWLSTGFVVVILCFFPLLFFAACTAANCGQGAIGIFVLGPIWIASALLTMTSAALAHYKFAP